MCAASAVSSCFSLPYASLRYWMIFASRAFTSATLRLLSMSREHEGCIAKSIAPHTRKKRGVSRVELRRAQLALVRPAPGDAGRPATGRQRECRVDRIATPEREREPAREAVAGAVAVARRRVGGGRRPLAGAALGACPTASSSAGGGHDVAGRGLAPRVAF